MSPNPQYDVTILGAGITGLIIGYLLKKKGLNPVILEKQDRVGGSVLTLKQDGFLIDAGPNSTLETSPRIQELIGDLQLSDEKIYANPVSNKRYIVRKSRLNALPMSPPAFLKTKLFSFPAKLRLFMEPFISASDPQLDESLADFVRRRLGREFLDYAIDPFVSGVYAGVPDKLSVKAAFPKLYALEQNYGSILKGAIKGKKERAKRQEVSKSEAKMFSFRSGMDILTDTLAKKLDGHIKLNCIVSNIVKSDDLIETEIIHDDKKEKISSKTIALAIPAYEAAELIKPLDQALSESLQSIEYPPVAMVFFGYNSKESIQRPLDGFGFLVPKKENRGILGTIWSSSIFENRAPGDGVALTTFVGGMRQPENVKLEDEYLKELVFNDLNDLIGLHKEPDVVIIKKWMKAIPQYQQGHLNIISKVEKFEKEQRNIFLTANYRGGIALGDCIKNAFDYVDVIEKSLT